MMKLRHAATLALVGWYLLLPPIKLGILPNGQTGPRLGSQLPLADWDNLGSYDSARECERDESKIYRMAE
jgi:hypothetical protein